MCACTTPCRLGSQELDILGEASEQQSFFQELEHLYSAPGVQFADPFNAFLRNQKVRISGDYVCSELEDDSGQRALCARSRPRTPTSSASSVTRNLMLVPLTRRVRAALRHFNICTISPSAPLHCQLRYCNLACDTTGSDRGALTFHWNGSNYHPATLANRKDFEQIIMRGSGMQSGTMSATWRAFWLVNGTWTLV